MSLPADMPKEGPPSILAADHRDATLAQLAAAMQPCNPPIDSRKQAGPQA